MGYHIYATLPVEDGSEGFHGKSWLYEKTLLVDVAPRTGDEMHILWNRTDQEWYLNHGVKRHYWDGDGKYHIEFRHILIDPTSEVEEHNRRFLSNEQSRGYKSQWWTNRDGDLIDALWASGWKEYRP